MKFPLFLGAEDTDWKSVSVSYVHVDDKKHFHMICKNSVRNFISLNGVCESSCGNVDSNNCRSSFDVKENNRPRRATLFPSLLWLVAYMIYSYTMVAISQFFSATPLHSGMLDVARLRAHICKISNCRQRIVRESIRRNHGYMFLHYNNELTNHEGILQLYK